MSADKGPGWLPGRGGCLPSRGLPASSSPLTEPYTRASADQAVLGLCRSRGRGGMPPTTLGTFSIGAGAPRRPERTPAERPHQHACE